MPAGDRTGPLGMGPRTGRGAGYCGGYDAPGWVNPAPGAMRGYGYGRGWRAHRTGRGWRHRNWYHATGVPGWARFGDGPAWGPTSAWEAGPYAGPAPEQEVEFLRRQAEMLQHELDAIARRVEELTTEA